MLINDTFDFWYYDDSLTDVMVSELLAESAAQDSFFEQDPNFAIHQVLSTKKPIEVHAFDFAGDPRAWIIRIYTKQEALIAQVGEEFQFCEYLALFVEEHRKRMREGEDGPGTFYDFAKEYALYVWMTSVLSGGRL